MSGPKGVVEPRDVQLLDTRQRVMVRQADVEREKRAKFVNAGGAILAAASDTMMTRPLRLQLRHPQSLVDISADAPATSRTPSANWRFPCPGDGRELLPVERRNPHVKHTHQNPPTE